MADEVLAVGGEPVADELREFGQLSGVTGVQGDGGHIATSGQLAFLPRLAALLVRSR